MREGRDRLRDFMLTLTSYRSKCKRWREREREIERERERKRERKSEGQSGISIG